METMSQMVLQLRDTFSLAQLPQGGYYHGVTVPCCTWLGVAAWRGSAWDSRGDITLLITYLQSKIEYFTNFLNLWSQQQIKWHWVVSMLCSCNPSLSSPLPLTLHPPHPFHLVCVEIPVWAVVKCYLQHSAPSGDVLKDWIKQQSCGERIVLHS